MIRHFLPKKENKKKLRKLWGRNHLISLHIIIEADNIELCNLCEDNIDKGKENAWTIPWKCLFFIGDIDNFACKNGILY